MKKVTLAIIILILVSACAKEEAILGGDKDEHGCIASAGYLWCESSQRCQRFWQEPCFSEPESYCLKEDVEAVYDCKGLIKVVSSLAGAGSTYYKEDNTKFSCPVLAPDSMAEECRDIINKNIRCVKISCPE